MGCSNGGSSTQDTPTPPWTPHLGQVGRPHPVPHALCSVEQPRRPGGRGTGWKGRGRLSTLGRCGGARAPRYLLAAPRTGTAATTDEFKVDEHYSKN